MELRKIMCAVDFSESSHEALFTAAELSKKTQATLVLVHVDEPPLWVNEPYMHLPGDVRQELRVRVETQLEAWKVEARQRGAAAVETSLLSGSPWDRIVAAARQDPTVDVILVGTHGRTGLKRAVIGSVAERVVRHAPCSVVVVRPRQHEGHAS